MESRTSRIIVVACSLASLMQASSCAAQPTPTSTAVRAGQSVPSGRSSRIALALDRHHPHVDRPPNSGVLPAEQSERAISATDATVSGRETRTATVLGEIPVVEPPTATADDRVPTVEAPAETPAGDIPIVEGPPPGFEVVQLTDVDAFFDVPDINDRGEVVWSWLLPPDVPATVWRYSDGVVLKLTDESMHNRRPVINNLSQMAWMSGPEQMTPYDVLADFGAGLVDIDADHQTNYSLDMNDDGDVVWPVDMGGGVKEIFLYTRATGTVEQISNNGVFSQGPRINNTRDVVWQAFNDQISPWTSQIMRYRYGSVTNLTPGDGQRQPPDINDLGQVVWEEAGVGLYLWDGVTTSLVVPDAILGKINNSGDMCYLKWLRDQELFTVYIKTGETTYHLPTPGLTIGYCDINELGEVALRMRPPGTLDFDLGLLRRVAALGDLNDDCHIDLADVRIAQVCFTESGAAIPLLAACTRADLDNDGDVDLRDVRDLIELQTGPMNPISGCGKAVEDAIAVP